MQLSFSNGSGTPINVSLPSQFAGNGQGTPNISLSFSNNDAGPADLSRTLGQPEPTRPPANQQMLINNLGRKLQLAKNLNDVQNRVIQSAQQDLQQLRRGGTMPPVGGGGRYTVIPSERSFPLSRFTPIGDEDEDFSDLPQISMSNTKSNGSIVGNNSLANIIVNFNGERFSAI